MTNRKRGQFDELCMDHDSGAAPASDPDDLEDVEKRLERCTGKDRKSSDNRQADNLMIKYPWGGMKIDGQMFF